MVKAPHVGCYSMNHFRPVHEICGLGVTCLWNLPPKNKKKSILRLRSVINPRVRNPIIVALDVPDAANASALAADLALVVGAFKIGSELFTSAGPDIVRKIRASGGEVFLDLKFHD